MSKAARQKMIIKIIETEEVRTQSELQEALRSLGYEATQATISRDIKDVGLIKTPLDSHQVKYSLPNQIPGSSKIHNMGKLFRDNVISAESSENIIVLKTLPGTASAVAGSIDTSSLTEVIGTVAGDDNVLVVVKPKDVAAKMVKIFRSLMD